ncbi:hypothetical protein BC938DRAFT_482995 [Jimgerdemannia flammicorona]|uniref:Regulator of chromosome condensation 1/beta-lactamase-inhibitor protein II n=1 Tax=Jimgerdemannia flammicorona TaxID=994334 RepID=A0A433QCS8_9FUNG|nr:hypothetical protein BC938DRAFT_482995 [Jimgerdemannia flammicorona]
MLRSTLKTTRLIHTIPLRRNPTTRPRFTHTFAAGALLGGVLAVGSSAFYLHNDAKEDKAAVPNEVLHVTPTTWSQQEQVNRSMSEPGMFVWGSNRYGIAAPNDPQSTVRSPKRFDFFDGKFLRSVALAKRHAAAVDDNGDVYQWGDNFFGPRPTSNDTAGLVPELTLKGRKIVSVALSQDKLYALSSNGTLYILPASKQHPNEIAPSSPVPTKPSSSWWPFGSAGDDGKLPPHVVTANLDLLDKGERITSIAAGAHHILAVTSTGRVLSAVADPLGNRFGQLGLGHVGAGGALGELRAVGGVLEGVKVVEIACGDEHNVARSADGRAFTFGSNAWGQLAQGDYTPTTTLLATPTEVTLLYNPSSPTARQQHRPEMHWCLRVAAGGDNTLFVVDRVDTTSHREVTEMYAVGMGQYGQLGNGQWTHMQGVPVKVLGVSGLLEYKESINKTVPVRVRDVALGATHAVVVLDNDTNVTDAADAGTPHYGHDVLIWGHNQDWQIGNGKRNNIAVPIHPLPLNGPVPTAAAAVNRLQLVPETRVRGRDGKQIVVGQRVAAGPGVTAVYSYVKA